MATSNKFRFTLQDLIHHGSRYIKYWGIAVQLFLFGIVLSLAYFTYGTPVYYSRSNAGFTNVTLPLKSETSDGQGRGRYAQVSVQVLAAFNSRWLIEETARHLGLVDRPGQYEAIRSEYIQSVRVGMLPADILQIEVYAYQPWLVKAWPEAMIATYEIATVAARAKHRDSAYKAYTDEMKRLRERIMTEMEQRSKFEEDNQLIEQYIRNNGIEAVPSEMLTIKNRQETMRLVDDMLVKPGLPVIEKLSLLKKFSKSPVSVGSIVRSSSVRDSLIAKSSSGGGQSTTVDLTSDAQRPVSGGAPGQIVVIPSMVEELEPWEQSERKLRSLLLEKDQASRKFLPGHEAMRKMDKEIENLTDSISNELATALNSFQLEKRQLQERFEELQTKMPDYRRVLNDFDRYKQEFNLMAGGSLSWEGAYANLQQRINAMEFTGIELKIDFDFQGFTLLRDDIPVSPNKSKLLQYGLLLGVGTAAAGCLALEKLKSSTSIVYEVEELTHTNSLGIVPLIQDEDLIQFNPIGEGALSLLCLSGVGDLSETFRIVRASLPLYTQSDNRLQVVMVTSSRASEGKTTVSALTARSFAESGDRTLLIDADLRRGRVHRLIQGKQNAGLGGFLASQVDNIRDVIVPSSIPNLDLITRGRESVPLYQNLSSDRVELALSDLRKTYDRIIIDTPPLLGLADSIMIGKHVDGAIFVVRSSRTSQRDILTALDILKGAKVPLYGFVLNGVDLSKVENYYYYSSYYPKYYDPSYVGITTA